MGNGPKDWGAMFENVPEDAEFAFVSEIVGSYPQKTYLWNVMQDLEIPEGAKVIDCGAHKGQEAEVLESLGVYCVSFEPHPVYGPELAERFKDSEFVVPHVAAVSTHYGGATLYESTQFDSGSTTNPAKIKTKDEGFKVATVRLADVLRDEAPVFMLKLDIEGTEWEVLEDCLDEGVLKDVEHIYLEDHTNRMVDDGFTHDLRRKVRRRCEEQGIVLKEWV